MSSPCGTPLVPSGTGQPPDPSGLCPQNLGPAVLDLYIYQGDDWRRDFRWDRPLGTPAVDLTGAAIKLQVRKGPIDNYPDPPLFEASVGDGITITSGPNAEFEILLTAAKTVLLIGSDPYVYDLQVTPSGGDATTILRGGIYFDLQVTT